MKKLAVAAFAALTALLFPFVLHAQPDPEIGTQIGALVDASRSHDWQVALAAGLGLVAWAMRRFLQPFSFVHTRVGAFVIAGASAVIGALVPVLQAHGFTVAALVGALASGITAALALANPTVEAVAETGIIPPTGAGAAGSPPVSLVPPAPSVPTAPPGPRVPPLLLLVGLGLSVGLATGLSGCACLKAENAQKAECVIEHQVIDCAKQAGATLLPVIGSIISGFINTGSLNIDWTWIEQRLEAAGVVSGSCIFANLTNDVVSKAALSPVHAARAEQTLDRFTDWKMHHGLAGVKFKVRSSDGQAVLR